MQAARGKDGEREAVREHDVGEAQQLVPARRRAAALDARARGRHACQSWQHADGWILCTMVKAGGTSWKQMHALPLARLPSWHLSCNALTARKQICAPAL